MNRLALLALFCLLNALAAQPQNREEKVRNDKKTVEAAGYWIYNDLPKAFAEAKASGKPIVAVLRCVPCVECVKLDDDLIDADATIKPLLEQFIRVRIVSTNGLDLSLFQFDTDQSFAVFFFNADGTIYGRFGTRSHRTNWIGDVSVEGLAKAMRGALALHRDIAKHADALKAKRGPAPEMATPELFPALKEKYKAKLNYEGKVVPSCIHCHQIGDARRDLLRETDVPPTSTIAVTVTSSGSTSKSGNLSTSTKSFVAVTSLTGVTGSKMAPTWKRKMTGGKCSWKTATTIPSQCPALSK